jgi:predicted nucleotidyltransferase
VIKHSDIFSEQKEKIASLTLDTINYISSINKNELEAILLSGSVARGDYFPGKYGGMIDLTIMTQKNSKIAAEELLGKNEDPDIPYHCVKRMGNWFQIAFHQILDLNDFKVLDESKKYAILESKILWQKRGMFAAELNEIKHFSCTEQQNKKEKCLGYIGYLLSEYKKNRWEQRAAYLQLHENLNTAINAAIKCLYYINGKYAPSEDRQLYYSFDLEILPNDYERVVNELFSVVVSSRDDYLRREDIFQNKLLCILS